jgi:predicted MarR family transcription regulator
MNDETTQAKTLRELEDLYVCKQAASEAFTAAIAATAEKSGYSKRAIRRAVIATVTDKIAEQAQEIEEVKALLNLEGQTVE